MTFKAEVKQVKSRKTASLDIVYQLVLESDNSELLELGTLPADSLVNVTVEAE